MENYTEVFLLCNELLMSLSELQLELKVFLFLLQPRIKQKDLSGLAILFIILVTQNLFQNSSIYQSHSSSRSTGEVESRHNAKVISSSC